MKKHHKLSDYEAARWHEIERWRAAPPDWGTQVLAGPSRIAALAAQKLVPESALRAAMRGVDQAAGWSSAQADVLRRRCYLAQSQTEIAAEPGGPFGTVKSRLVSGLRRMRVALDGER